MVKFTYCLSLTSPEISGCVYSQYWITKHYFSKINICEISQSIKHSKCNNAFCDFRMSNLGWPCHTQSEEDCEYEVTMLVLGYDQYGLIDSIFNTLNSSCFSTGHHFTALPTLIVRSLTFSQSIPMWLLGLLWSTYNQYPLHAVWSEEWGDGPG